MEQLITYDIDFHINQKSVANVENTINGLGSYFEDAWENAGEFTLETFKTQADALFEDIGEAWDKTTGSWGDTAGDAISGSLSAIFSGEMDDLDEIWDNAWDETGEQAHCPLAKARAFTPPVPLRLAA